MDLSQLHWAWQTLIAALLVIGGVFMLIGALSEFGKLGLVSIDVDREAARRRFRGTVTVLDEESATPPAA